MDVGGVGIQYLDWGGRGPLLVLLPGFGLNPHVFDDLAPRLTDRFRVVAMAPRGVAGSDAPDTGYTLAGVAEDVRVLIDRLGADRAVLGAHSIGGVAVTHFAARYPGRLRGLVYIDASPEDWTGGTAAAGAGPVPRPALSPDSATSDDAYRRYVATYLYGTWTPALEAQLRTYVTGYDGERRRFLVKQYADDAAARPATLRALRGLRVPVLAICAIPEMRQRYPWLLPESIVYRDGRRYLERSLQPAARALCDAFEATVPTARAVKIPGSHFLFITDPDRVAREIRQWLTTEELKP